MISAVAASSAAVRWGLCRPVLVLNTNVGGVRWLEEYDVLLSLAGYMISSSNGSTGNGAALSISARASGAAIAGHCHVRPV